jgi:hypothetical protein
MIPAQQGFHTLDLSALDIYQRLIMQDQLATFRRTSQTVFQFQPFHGMRVHFRRVELEIITARVFGAVHGRIGVL